MILALCFCERDQDLALKNIRWWNELGGCKGHKAVLWRDRRTSLDIAKEIQAEAHKCFDDVLVFTAGAEIDGWPEGANYFLRIASGYLQNRNERYFLWMEPDAIPITPGWMDQLEAEYKKAGKPFMGDRVEVNNVPLHMSGIGIYWNPLHEKAGEAYRAHEVAWDVAAMHQIVPNAHFTELIEHAWKHPSFTSVDELTTQISDKTVLFHSSKDGSLIDLLQQRRRGSVAIPDTTKEPTTRSAGSPSPLCDIFIKTYPQDYVWLKFCLQSINKYASGFRKIWIISPEDVPMIGQLGYEWKVMNEECPDGYLAQQIHKLYADVITDYQADYILHIDSDTLFTRPVTPQSFFRNDKLIWYYTPYKEVETPWQPITEKFMGDKVENEFMRRLPIMMPRWIYSNLRTFCSDTHGQILSDYIRQQPSRAFSEFNALGAFAWKFHHDHFAWVNTLEGKMPEPLARQFFSWDGITDPVKEEIENILSGKQTERNTKAVVPRSTIPLHMEPTIKEPEEPGSPAQIPSGIKALPNGIWVIEGDTHVSQWIEKQERLDHDMNTLPFILPYIDKGDTVVDAGAFVGDHTIAYAKAVGETGTVFAFEPSPLAFECLLHNMAGFENVIGCNAGLSSGESTAPLSGNNGNHGGAYIGEHMKIADVKLRRLDSYSITPHLIKFDVEGCEVEALHGARETIQKSQPVLVIEVNSVALSRQGCIPDQIFDFLKEQNYGWRIMQENCTIESPMYDIIATPPLELSFPEGLGTKSPRAERQDMEFHVKSLVEYAAKGNSEKIQVAMQLRKHKLVKTNKEILKKGRKVKTK